MKVLNLMMAALQVLLIASVAAAAVDTLRGTSAIEDGIIYSWANCNIDVTGEDCRRYNAGAITYIQIGAAEAGEERRALLRVPGFNGVLPDSSKLLLYCFGEVDAGDRKIFAYPVTRRFFEGTELAYNIGDYPNPDSGVTWNHAYLDVGAGDSSNWTSPGGDYTTAVACTMIVTDTGQYFAFNKFNRILNYWDTSGNDFGCILINQNAFPANTSMKTFRSTEGDTIRDPMVLLYYPDSVVTWRRRSVITAMVCDGR